MAKRGRKKGKRGGIPALSLKPETVQTVLFISIVILALITAVSFVQTGPVPTQYNLALTQLFGFGAVMVPFIMTIMAFLFAKIKSPFKEPNVVLGSLVMFISVLGLFQQGQTGNFLWDQIFILFGALTTSIIFFFTALVGFVVLFDTSIAQIIKTIITFITTIRRYTVGLPLKKSKDAIAKNSQAPTYVQSHLDTQPLPSKTKFDDDPVVAGVSPILRSTPASSPISSLVNTESKVWQYPDLSLFDDTPGAKADRGDTRRHAQIIEQTLDSFGITARVAEVNNSPSVTQYALEVALGTKLAKIMSLSNDLAMALAAPGGQIRVEAPIPGRSLVGIEVPNRSLEVVPIRKIMESEPMRQAKSKITVPLGLDVAGQPKVADIAKMPHVLIAGQTGSGKSVCVNSWISTLLYRASPQEVRLIMVDPKRVELTPYNGIPHLLVPVIVEPERVVSALKWAVSEMERRYKMFTEVGAKNLEGYNNLSGFQNLPYIVIFIDELAEIMLFSPAEVEDNICRLAQMARAVGIHLVLATQRPSVNVITGLIKANVPTRIAFAVASMTDSRVILDSPGAEKLLGRGDMLYIPPDIAKPVRIQGCFISEKETNRLIDFLKAQKSTEYNDDILQQPVKSPNSLSKNIVQVDGAERDAVFNDAVDLIKRTGKASASLFQRHLKLGYARAARLLDQLEQAGVVGPGQGAKARQILIPHAEPSDEIE
jgi:S-DNA-T family DNA segregation ATPase FtsK/SpoIIIE